MVIILSKSKFTILGLILVFLIPVCNRIYYILKSSRTIGNVTEIVVYQGYNGNSNYGAKIDFYTNDSMLIKFEAIDIVFKSGVTVPVIYRNDNPEDAIIYTFLGFWFVPFLWWSLVPFLFLCAFNLAFLRKKSQIKITIPFKF